MTIRFLTAENAVNPISDEQKERSRLPGRYRSLESLLAAAEEAAEARARMAAAPQTFLPFAAEKRR